MEELICKNSGGIFKIIKKSETRLFIIYSNTKNKTKYEYGVIVEYWKELEDYFIDNNFGYGIKRKIDTDLKLSIKIWKLEI